MTYPTGYARPSYAEILEEYNPKTMPKLLLTPHDVIEKRVNSKGYHDCRKLLKLSGLTKQDIDELATIEGQTILTMWKTRFSL